jgi:3-hydroxyacyl-[acyl-carrier-protein] dehydratase
VLKEARNVKYGNFVAPGNALRVEVEFFKAADHGGATFKATGFVGTANATANATAVAARIELAYFNLSDKQPELAGTDEKLRQHNRQRWALLDIAMNHETKNAPNNSPVTIGEG